MNNIVIFGAPGSGKGTQSDKIIAEFGVEHISTGEVLRAEIKAGTELGKTAALYINDGNLVPDALIIDMLAATLDKKGKDIKGVIFDGFPRTIAQAEALDKMGIAVDKVLSIELSDEEILKRLSGRRECASCRATYHIEDKPPVKEGKCDRCGGELICREDDKPETIKHRLAVYEESTAPLKSYYEEKGILVTAYGKKLLEDTKIEVLKALGEVK